MSWLTDWIPNWVKHPIDTIKAKLASGMKSLGETVTKEISDVADKTLGNVKTSLNNTLNGTGLNADGTTPSTDDGSNPLTNLLGKNFSGLTGNTNTATTTTDTQPSPDAPAETGNVFGGGIGGFLMGLLMLVFTVLLSAGRGIASLFGGSKEPEPSKPDDNFITKAIHSVKTVAHEAYEWMGQKIDKIASPIRGIRNNNPGNVITSKSHKWEGEVGSDGKFVVFKTVGDGMHAMANNLRGYKKNHNANTIKEIIHNWAPSSDGNNEVDYVAQVSKWTRIPPDQQLNLNDPYQLAILMKAMTRQENGGKVPYPDEIYSYGAMASIDPASVGKAPNLVKQKDSQYYAIEDVGTGHTLLAANTPKLNLAGVRNMTPSTAVTGNA